jgi:hypothetical protein
MTKRLEYSNLCNCLVISVLYFKSSRDRRLCCGVMLDNNGSAQSVVAFAFIRRNVDQHYTPVQWIKEMTPVIFQILIVLTVIIYAEGALLD